MAEIETEAKLIDSAVKLESEDSESDKKSVDTPKYIKNEETPETVNNTKTEDTLPKDATLDIKNEENGINTDSEKPSLQEMKIIRQVEYYFGNVNLWRDKFLKEKVKEDDGWVTLECLITFNRLQALTMDFDEIITALQKSKTGLLEIHEEKRKVRRSPNNPLPDPDDPILRKASKMKTLHVKGFPNTYTLDDVQDFILSQECQNIFIKMKYDDRRKFKGSILVEMATLEEAEKFLATELKCGDNTLKVMRRDDYYEQKNEKRHNHRSGGKRRHDDDANGYGKRTKSEENEEGEEDTEPPRLGCVLHFKGCSNDTSREDLKTLFGEHGTVEWVDLNKGDVQGYIRFAEAGSAQPALDGVKAANEGKLIIKEKECEGKVIEGIEEKNYWILAIEDMKRAAKNKKQNRFQNNRGGKRNFRKDRGQEGWRKRRREWEYPKDADNSSEEQPKNQRTTFDDEGNAVNNTTNEVAEKRPKVEEKTAVEV